MFGDERERPYERPPLSKEVLLSGDLPDSLWLFGKEASTEQGFELSTGACVARLDLAARVVETETGEIAPYEHLVLATGGAPRRLASLTPDRRRVFELRTAEDALALHAALAHARRCLVVGGGWLGLEVAATLRQRGCDVSLVEAAPRLCERSVPPEVSDYLYGLQKDAGVDVRLGACAAPFLAPDGIRLADDEPPYDLAVVAIGMAARDELAAAAGLETADGVLTDFSGATALPGVFAIGDVARLRAPGGGPGMRLESWRHAEVQGRLAAAAILGRPEAYDEPAWFWSDQFGKLIQIAGLPAADLELLEAEGGDKPLWRYGRGGEVRAVIAVGRARDVRMAQRSLPALPACMSPAGA